MLRPNNGQLEENKPLSRLSSLSPLSSSTQHMARGWTAAPPAQPLPRQRYLGLPRPEAEGHPGQQYNSSRARVPEGVRPERRDLGGCRLREKILPPSFSTSLTHKHSQDQLFTGESKRQCNNMRHFTLFDTFLDWIS